MKQEPFINYTKEAFALPINLIFLTVAVLVTIATYFITDGLGLSNSIPMVVAFFAAALECLYLATMPQNERFVRGINAKNRLSNQTISRQLSALRHLQALNEDFFQRYITLCQKKQQIRDNLVKNTALNSFTTEQLSDKVEVLESYFIEQLYGVQQYETIQSQHAIERLEQEKNKILAEMSGANQRVQEFQKKRLNVIQKRIESFYNAKDNVDIARIQLDTIDDVMNLILEQSLTLKNPDEVSRIIDAAVAESAANYDYIRELETIYTPSVMSSVEDVNDEDMNFNRIMN